jgi:RNA polymerase sigma-70 factor (ECF subfamily)
MQTEMAIKPITITIEEKEAIDSFPLLVEKYQQMVFRTCFAFLKCREDAEDIAQEVFVEVYRSYQNFRGDASLSTWIYRIAINRCMDHVRMKSRKKRNLFAFRSFGNDEMARIHISTSINPQNILEQKEKEILINNAINQLPERQRMAFVLSKVDGLKQEKVAEIMETSIASVESLLIRAKSKLKSSLVKHLNQLFDE